MTARSKIEASRTRLGAGAALAMALVLAGCGVSTTGEQSIFVLGCQTDRAELVADADWDQAHVLKARIRDGDYRPSVIHLTLGRAYTVTVENADGAANNLWAPALLKQGVALESIRIGDAAPVSGCVNGIRIQPRAKIELRFVPVTQGRYVVHNTALPVIPGQVPDAIVYVNPPRDPIVEN